jgi:hypothetical protein
MIDYSAVLTFLYPDSEWTLNGDSYDGLTWLSDSPKPTKKSLEDAWPEVQHANAVRRVEETRAEAYRETSDPLFFQWQRGDATEADWLAAVEAVKTAHPYPGK